MEKDLISVAIPVYNAEKYIRETLNSVLMQSHQNIEVICVNDGSTDNSLAILEEYAKKDNRITIINQANQGAGIARNRGLSAAKGEYLIFFDADDVMEADAIEMLYKKAITTDADVTICRSIGIDAEGLPSDDMSYSIKEYMIDYKDSFATQDYVDIIFQIFVGWPWDKLYRRSLLTDNGLQYQQMHNSEDTYFVLMSLILSSKISCIYDAKIKHRWHNSSLSNSRTSAPGCCYEALCQLRDDMLARGVYEKFERSFVNYCLEFNHWYYTSMGDKRCKEIIANLFVQLLTTIGFSGKSRDYFYDDQHYYWAIWICNSQKTFSITEIERGGRRYKRIKIFMLKIDLRIG